MKNLIIASAVCALILSACSYKTNQEEIIGTWKATSLRVNNVETLDSSAATTNYKMAFTEDVVTITSDADTINYTYVVNESQLIFDGAPVQYYTLDTLREDYLVFHGVNDSLLFQQYFVKE
jgi:hypothetical protein